jgi:hypothetical protein
MSPDRRLSISVWLSPETRACTAQLFPALAFLHRRGLAERPQCYVVPLSSSSPAATAPGSCFVLTLIAAPDAVRQCSVAVAWDVSAALKTIALYASTTETQLWLQWTCNHLFAARAISILSSEALELVGALCRMTCDQTALLGHLVLPKLLNRESSPLRVFVAPTPLRGAGEAAAAVQRWVDTVEPLVAAGFLRLETGVGGAVLASDDSAQAPRSQGTSVRAGMTPGKQCRTTRAAIRRVLSSFPIAAVPEMHAADARSGFAERGSAAAAGTGSSAAASAAAPTTSQRRHHLHVAAEAHATVFEGTDSGTYSLRPSRSLLRAVHELSTLTFGTAVAPDPSKPPALEELQFPVAGMLLGTARLMRFPLSHRGCPAPFVLFPHRVSLAQFLGAHSWARQFRRAAMLRLLGGAGALGGGAGEASGGDVEADGHWRPASFSTSC